jgi:hypothetical protein
LRKFPQFEASADLTTTRASSNGRIIDIRPANRIVSAGVQNKQHLRVHRIVERNLRLISVPELIMIVADYARISFNNPGHESF